MIEIPRWRAEQKPVWIPCKTVRLMPDGKEFIVQFDLDGQEYTTFAPPRFVNEENSGLGACIVADVNEGVLVDIPAETFTCGRRLLIRDETMLMPFHPGQ